MSVTHASGFQAAGVEAGIKPEGRDLAVVIARNPATAGGVFTRNAAAAPPVHLSRRHLAGGGPIRAVVINSGCANAATADTGMRNAEAMAALVAGDLGVEPVQVLVCSTGTIGPQLPMDRVAVGISKAVTAALDEASSAWEAADAIRTTDSVTKEATVDGSGWRVGGMAKGAGMIRPDMATMLGVLTTDAIVDASTAQRVIADAVDATFNALNIDGCESTNDSVILLASGDSGVAPDEADLRDAVTSVCRDLALQMARDAEGASRVVTIDVDGAESDLAAREHGKRVADSALVRPEPGRAQIEAPLTVRSRGQQPPANPRASLEQHGVDGTFVECRSDGEAGDAGADDHDIGGGRTHDVESRSAAPQSVFDRHRTVGVGGAPGDTVVT